ncbi:hypothetical protein LP419_36315 [Massilia sp. H-1]|nr:hypothetical protein LP419_36315 [Massilia sp. H-1]
MFTVFEARLLRAAFSAKQPCCLGLSVTGLAIWRRPRRRPAALRSRMALPVVILTIALFVAPIPQLFLGLLTPTAYLWKVVSPLLVIAALAAAAVRLNAWFGSGAHATRPARSSNALLAVPVFGALHLRRNARDFVESLALLFEARPAPVRGAAGGPRYRRQPPGAPRSGRDRPGRQGRRAAVAGDRRAAPGRYGAVVPLRAHGRGKRQPAGDADASRGGRERVAGARPGRHHDLAAARLLCLRVAVDDFEAAPADIMSARRCPLSHATMTIMKTPRSFLPLVLLPLLLAACTSQTPLETPRAPAAATSLSRLVSAGRAGRQKVYAIDSAQSLITIIVRRGGPMARFGHDHVVASRGVTGFAAPEAGRADFQFRLDELSVDEEALQNRSLASPPSRTRTPSAKHAQQHAHARARRAKLPPGAAACAAQYP